MFYIKTYVKRDAGINGYMLRRTSELPFRKNRNSQVSGGRMRFIKPNLLVLIFMLVSMGSIVTGQAHVWLNVEEIGRAHV